MVHLSWSVGYLADTSVLPSIRLCVCVCVCVCVYVCVFVCVCVCVCVMHACMLACMCACVHVCATICMSMRPCMHTFVYASVRVSVHANPSAHPWITILSIGWSLTQNWLIHSLILSCTHWLFPSLTNSFLLTHSLIDAAHHSIHIWFHWFV